MAEYTGPATDNEAVVIAQMDGRKVPDTYGTGFDNEDKIQAPHAKRIHNDVYGHYGTDASESEPC